MYMLAFQAVFPPYDLQITGTQITGTGNLIHKSKGPLSLRERMGEGGKLK